MEKLFKFGLVGIVNTLISIGFYMLFVKLGMNYILANILSYMIGLLNSYYWNKKWVFKNTGNHLSVFTKFVMVNLIVLGINTLSLFLLVNKLGLNQYVAQLISTVIGMGINFILNKKWTFEAKVSDGEKAS
ncbi:GtrA family protein [Neobacillus cucumis]|uniref:GtrA family protein n=1 Tax=Neobacillus cucumis TaxID=1740721 RepID=UPI0019645C2F|nr:GtrA family protein [Neobacillus cucumis]MBM7654755.1 putative flippase GtrA [Neobacillus cucumis]MDR4949489.1 GtrA family protein [Neobacillus cucumis]MED4228521.1 GtrA family protein [Neobacillus cucumis]